MRILILNWRDIKNPKSGGAEILTHEIAKRLVKKGHTVIQFSSKFKKSKKKETIEGVQIIRDGSPDLRFFFSSVHFKAFQYYKKGMFGDVDVVVDEVHGVPFFTPLYVTQNKIALICEYAGNLWDRAVAPPFNTLGKFTERIYPYLYNSVQFVTISKSSKIELQKKLHIKKNISIISPGCSTSILLRPIKKDKLLSLIFIARLAKSKGVMDAIKVTAIIKKTNPDVLLHIVGRGESSYVQELKEYVKKNNLSKNIIFHGFVSEKEKIKLIDESYFLLITSEKEGWGLTVHEANARGVPAAAYNISGVRDVIKNGVNGFLAPAKIPEDIARQILTAFHDHAHYNLMAKNSILERKKYTWDKTTDEFLALLKK